MQIYTYSKLTSIFLKWNVKNRISKLDRIIKGSVYYSITEDTIHYGLLASVTVSTLVALSISLKKNIGLKDSC